MAAYKHLAIDEFERILNDIIIVSFRYSVICGKNTNDIERVYNNLAIQISTNQIYARELLRDVYVDDTEFLPIFNHKAFPESQRNNKIVKYILGKYERLKGGTRDVPLISETDTIEHILPKNPGEEWGDNNYDFDTLIYRVGNLCLLEKNYNKDLQNKPYDEKIKTYRLSAFATTRNIADAYSTWDSTAINLRQEHIGDCAKSIWKIDFK